MTLFPDDYRAAIRTRVRMVAQGVNPPSSLHIPVLAAKYGKTEAEVVADLEAATPPKRVDEPEWTYD